MFILSFKFKFEIFLVILKRMSEEIIQEIIIDKSSDSDSEESWYNDETSNFDKIGMVLIQYEDIIDLVNLRKIIHLCLSDNIYDNYKFKIINMYTKKHKDLNKKILNNFIMRILCHDLRKLIYDNNFPSDLNNTDICIGKDKSFEIRRLELHELIEKYEKVIEEYIDVISEDSVILYFDILSKI
tara:strand:- start:1848 stop:2399 length:552 start_codon:yes stop_codon:yes gene_type:complete